MPNLIERWTKVCLGLGCCIPVLQAADFEASDSFAGAPYRLRNARTGRVSSWDRTGNNRDFISFRPGETKELLSVNGPGALTHLYMTPAASPAVLRSAVLRIFWDDEPSPSVEAPLGDFFCAGECSPRLFASHYASVAYWYQTEPHQPFPRLPEDRMPSGGIASAPAIPGLIEAETLIEKATQSGGQRAMAVKPGAPYSRGEVALFRAREVGAWISFPVSVQEADRLQVMGRFARASDLGQYRLLVDGRPLGAPVDFYNGEGGAPPTHVIPTDEISFGTLALTTGEHELKFECTGKNERSTGHFLAVDGFALKAAK